MKKLISLLLTAALLWSMVPMTALTAHAQTPPAAAPAPNTEPKLWYDEPAANTYEGWETQSLPIGNSSIGGNVFGRYDTERVTLNEKTFWTGGPSSSRPNYMGGNLPDKGRDGAALKEIQDLFLAGKTAEGSAQMDRDLIGTQDGYGGYQMFGNLYLDFHHTDVSNYKRELQIMDGLATVDYDMAQTHYSREYLTSFHDNVMAIHLTAEGADTLDFSIRLEPENTDPARRTFTITADDSSLTLAGALDDNQLKFHAYLKVLIAGEGTSSVQNSNQLHIRNASDVTLLLSMATDYKNVFDTYRTGESDDELAARVKAVVERAAQKDYASLRQAHIADISSLMRRVHLDLDASAPDMPTDDMLRAYQRDGLEQSEKNYLETVLYQFGRYLLISSSRGDTLPANLQGLWAGKNGNMWASDYHMNVNLQMNYWPAYSGNLVECALPLIDYIDSLREPGRVTAKVYFGVESSQENPENGFTVHTQNTPFGWTCPGWDVKWGWSPAAAPWILQNCWEYYEYTGDLEFMKEKIYPMLKEETIFYAQIMRQDENGKWLSTPAYSPEHGPRTNGNTYEQSLIWQLFTDTIAAAKLVGEDPQLIAHWQEILDNLRTPIEVGTDGQVKEWYHETTLDSMKQEESQGYEHRHISHMLGLFPGDLISEETPDWFQAARVSMENRVDKSTGWAMGQRINTWARLGDGNKAYELINILMKHGILSNLWDTHPPFQIDGNFGYTAGVNEMLVQSNMGYLNILPALPDAWEHGSIDGILARGNFELGIDWYQHKAAEIRILSHNGGPATVQFAPGSSYTIEDSYGNVIPASPVSGTKNRITFDTLAGRTYIIRNTLPLGIPSGLSAARVDNHTIDLTWKPLYGAQQYNIYRSVNDGEPLLIAADITDTKFRDTTAYASTTHDVFHYSVSAIERSGTEGEQSEPVTVASRAEFSVDGADSAVKKTGEWHENNEEGHHAQTNNFSWHAGDTAELTFTGNGIAVYTLAKPNYNGFYVYIDDKKQGDWHSAYAAAETPNHLIYSNMTLPYGTHTIRLEVMDQIIPGSAPTVKDSSVSLDYFKVYQKPDSPMESVDVTSPSGVTVLCHTGQQLQLAADISPADAPNTAVQWSLTEPDGASTTLAEIDENGMVTVTGEGSGTLVATAASVFDPDCKNTMELDLQITEQGAKKAELLECLNRAALLLEDDFDAAGWKTFTAARQQAVQCANQKDAKEKDISAAKTALEQSMANKTIQRQLVKLKLNIGSLDMSVGMTQPIQVTAFYNRGVPVNCTANADITFDSDRITISDDGILQAQSAGTVVLSAQYEDKQAEAIVHVAGNPNGRLLVTSTSGGTVERNIQPPYFHGQSINLTAIPQPGYTFQYWQLDDITTPENPIAVQIGQHAKAQAVFIREHASGGGSSGGSSNGSSGSSKDEDTSVAEITLNHEHITLQKGQSMTLSAAIRPKQAAHRRISWSTSDSAIAQVKDGLVTAKSAGTAQITARAGSKTDTCTVTVLQDTLPKLWSFTDVPANQWYYESVKKAWEAGLIDGVSTSRFEPNSMLTVAEAIKLAAALHQLDTQKEVTLRSTNAELWYLPYLSYAVEQGILDNSYTQYTTEQMNTMISRTEFVKIFHGAMSHYAIINSIPDNSLPDVKADSKNAAEIYDFFRAGILVGCNEAGAFLPNSNIKRSEVAAILIRMFDATARQTIVPPSPSSHA